MGSGHILVCAFDRLMDVYKEAGYREQDAAEYILTHNLYGLDIDLRAVQLAQFALLMKARAHHPGIFTCGIRPHVYALPESSESLLAYLQDHRSHSPHSEELLALARQFVHGKEYGSLLLVPDNINFASLRARVQSLPLSTSATDQQMRSTLLQMLDAAELLARTYHLVITNPPYLGSRKMNARLTAYLKQHYPHTRYDLYAAFMQAGLARTKDEGYMCMVTMQNWMFLKSFTRMRQHILQDHTLLQLMHMNNQVMEIAFGTAVSLLSPQHKPEVAATYHEVRYEDLQQGIPKTFPVEGREIVYANARQFESIPGWPLAWRMHPALLTAFAAETSVGDTAQVRQGLATGDNRQFLRHWFELDIDSIGFDCANEADFVQSGATYVPYNKGGQFRRWQGNFLHVLRYDAPSREQLAKQGNRLPSRHLYFQPAISWSKVSSGDIAFRLYPQGFLFDVAGCSIFTENADTRYYLLGLLNSTITQTMLEALSPTLNYEVGHIAALPTLAGSSKETIAALAKQNTEVAAEDWDSFELSWNFKRHPMLADRRSVAKGYAHWKKQAQSRYQTLQQNEQRIHRLCIKAYGMDAADTPPVQAKNISITQIVDTKNKQQRAHSYCLDKKQAVESFLSYAVGCLFGRYSPHTEGLVHAGGSFNTADYKGFQPSPDNILLLTLEDTGQRDILQLFVELLSHVYGSDTREDNLQFISKALGYTSGSSRQNIRHYFYHHFYEQHVRRYHRTPLYWQLSSGPQGGFRALLYTHRYQPDLLGHVRIHCLHPLQAYYQQQLNSTKEQQSSEQAKPLRIQELRDKLQECATYDSRLAHLAPLHTSLALEDGIVHNHSKLQTGRDGKHYPILSPIR